MLKKIIQSVSDNTKQNSLASKLRSARFNKFINLFNITEKTTILDVGGRANTWDNVLLNNSITILNLEENTADDRFNYVVGNACEMRMFSDSSFDLIFSNSVIEHVGNFEMQSKFASEIMRVGKSFWVQTPYRHFPIEPHFLFPLFQYYPDSMKKYIGLRWKYSHLSGRSPESLLDELSRLRLVNKKELKKLFPSSIVLSEKFLGLTKSLIAVKTND